jgi:hypothetical protein
MLVLAEYICESEGPLKAYRHLNGLTEEGIEGANDSLRVMAESILRAKVGSAHELSGSRDCCSLAAASKPDDT